ncbi:bifunctional enoyl-CoA hydratase/phosphate acetyltransferase [Hoeflea sp. YIM 152468]|uniref:bifunctional enoyl-CoA hydratase/phosphate acetyltransferase n=1 Tax=Hoeflea sp. YIM 152468 TaxID=3031759 RepID=UPI0023D9D1B1|nr:bifunctional enoyl-CoA hydratase/phosphate acetyltransferase [Hoeflea sp. YIM 152468]MDF1609418.1 bifunctional enoyl-CoA hydratase/phosphate acetyltransferase [Hoeflea sp. YIM 152468]
MNSMENRTVDELEPGDRAEIDRVLTRKDFALFEAALAGTGPAGCEPEAGDGADPEQGIGHGIWAGPLISTLLATQLPGPGSVPLGQTLVFHRPVRIGDTVTVQVRVTAVDKQTGRVELDCACLNAAGVTVVSGTAQVLASREKIKRPLARMPSSWLKAPGVRFGELVERARSLEPLITAVVHPCDALSLGGAIAARDEGMIVPVLVGPRAKIEAAAEKAGVDVGGLDIVDAPHSHAAAEIAVGLVHHKRAGALMKGALHTDELLAAVLDKSAGLRTERRLSHVFALDLPGQNRTLFVTDAAINISPDLAALSDIVQNAIDLTIALGVDTPLVALLSAVETVTGKLPSTLMAAAICKMHDRGQIVGGKVDGPLAFDNAISPAAVAAKGLVSDVAGYADILVTPTLESGNMIAKQLIHLAGASSAGIALGGRVPIMLTSRSDSIDARIVSAALAKVFYHWRRQRPLGLPG